MSTPLRERPDAPLGTLIFRAGLLPAETIESALEEGVKTGKRLGEILTERGLISEVDLARLLAGQKGLDFVTLREQIVDTSAAGLFTEEQAKLFRALPYGFEDGMPVVAIADPTDEVLLRNIREGLGREDIKFVVSTRGELAEISTDVYSKPLQVATDPGACLRAGPRACGRARAASPSPSPSPRRHPSPLPRPFPSPSSRPSQWPRAKPAGHRLRRSPPRSPSPPPSHTRPSPAAPEPALDPEPEAPAVPHTNGVVPPEAAPLLQVPAPEPVVQSVPEPVPAAEPVLQVPAPDPLPQVEQPATPEPVAPVEPEPAPQPLQVSQPAPEPTPEPAPVLEPAATVEPLRAPEPVPTPEPTPAPEPIASPEPAPLPEPSPPPTPYPPAAAQPEHDHQPEPQPEPAPVTPDPVVPEAPAAEEGPATLWRVLIRLTNGEGVDAGDFADAEAAKQHAKSLMSQVADAEQGDWPFVSGRFLKPDTIVSVDIAEHDGDGPSSS